MDINKLQTQGTDIIRTTAPKTNVSGESAEVNISKRAEDPETAKDLSRQNLRDLAETLDSAARSINQRVSFTFNDKIDRVVMKVINTDNNEVVREIPSREMVRVFEHMHELIGMFVDESR